MLADFAAWFRFVFAYYGASSAERPREHYARLCRKSRDPHKTSVLGHDGVATVTSKLALFRTYLPLVAAQVDVDVDRKRDDIVAAPQTFFSQYFQPRLHPDDEGKDEDLRHPLSIDNFDPLPTDTPHGRFLVAEMSPDDVLDDDALPVAPSPLKTAPSFRLFDTSTWWPAPKK
jgi:hypothetical protein